MLSVDYAPDLAAWQSLIARSFVPMSVVAHPARASAVPFEGTIKRLQLGTVGMSLVVAEAHVARRDARNIALHPADYYKASVQVEGNCTLKQQDRHVEIVPGTMALYDTTRPYELLFAQRTVSLVIQIPRSALSLGNTTTDKLLGRLVDPLPGTSDFLESHFALTARCSPAEASHRGQSIIHLVSAIFMRATSTSGGDSTEAEALDAARRYALAHLSDPGLRQDDVARATFISVRSLQRAFASEGTSFACWVREQRLERAKAWILDTDQPIARIAMDCGFSSPQHFSRLFRDRYGMPARNLRTGT